MRKPLNYHRPAPPADGFKLRPSWRRILSGQRGITGLETAIILIAFVVVASVFAYTTLSAGMFTADQGREAIYSGLSSVQNSLELRGSVIGYRDSLNSSGNGSLGRVELTVTVFGDGSQADLTPAYTLDSGSGALLNSNPGGNRLLIAFIDQSMYIEDCAWTVKWIGSNNGDMILDNNEKAVISVWLHDYDGSVWGPAAAESTPFLGTNYVDTYHTFTLQVSAGSGPIMVIERTTPAYLDPVEDLR